MKSMANPDEAGAAAEDYLHLLGYVTLGYMWLRMVKVAKAKLAAGTNGNAAFYEAKVATGRFYFAKVLPQVHALSLRIAAGAAPVMNVPVSAF